MVLAVGVVVWGVIGLAVLFVLLMAVGRWLIREGEEIEERKRPDSD